MAVRMTEGDSEAENESKLEAVLLAGLKSGRFQMFMVRAKVYGLGFPRNEPFEMSGIRFRPKWIPRSVRAQAESQGAFLPTGEARCLIAAPTWTKALHEAHDGLFRLASHILTFAEARQVFFRNIAVEDEERSFRLGGWGRVGLQLGGPTRILADKVPEFAAAAMSKLESEAFREEARVAEAMIWVNETIMAPLANEELRLTMLWLGLESLVLANAPANAAGGILSKEEFGGLWKAVARWSKEAGLDQRRQSILGSRLAEATKAPIAERIMQFAKAHQIPLGEKELGHIVDARNSIQHEPWAGSYALATAQESLEHLLERSICTVLGLDWNTYLNPSYHRQESLLSSS